MSTATRARKAATNPWAEYLGRTGWFARAAVYAITALLIAQVAVHGGQSGKRADQKGALEAVAHKPLGGLLLVLLGLGLVAFVAGRVAEIVTSDDEGAKRLVKGIGYGCSALAQLGLAWIAVSLVVRHRGASRGKEQGKTAEVLSWNHGRLVVVGAGLIVIGIGMGFAVQAVRRKFVDHLDKARMSKPQVATAAWIGTIGLAARGVVYALAGLFLIDAARRYDPNRAVGFDGALRRVAGQPWGPWLLCAVACGMAAFAIHCLFMARYREIGD
jgi:hypothetical protein